MRLGYARVSTDDQTADLQVDALTKSGCVRIFVDRGVSGARFSRPALAEALRSLAPGDTLVTWKLDRLGRSLSHLIQTLSMLERRGIAFCSLTEAIDTQSATGRLLFHVMGALAEFERALISERTKAGLAAARLRGRRGGRPPKLSRSQVEAARQLLGADRSLRSVAEHFCVAPLTLKRAVSHLCSLPME